MDTGVKTMITNEQLEVKKKKKKNGEIKSLFLLRLFPKRRQKAH